MSLKYPRLGLRQDVTLGQEETCMVTKRQMPAGTRATLVPVQMSPFREDDKLVYMARDNAKDITVDEAMVFLNNKQNPAPTQPEVTTKEQVAESAAIEKDAGQILEINEDPEETVNHLISFEVHNVKRVGLVSLKLDGKTLVIGGNNDQGKSSTIDGLWYALGGQREIPGEPLKRGEDHGYATLTIDEYIITRKFTKKGTTLHVTTRDGTNVKSPQAVLDGLISKLSDPLKFLEMDEKQQGEEVRRAAGLDFTELDSKREKYYNERHSIGQELTRLKGAMEKAPHWTDVPTEKKSVTELSNELEAGLQKHQEIEDARKYIDSEKRNAEVEEKNAVEKDELVKDLERQIEVAKAKAAEFRTAAEESRKNAKTAEERLLKLVAPNLEPIREQIKNAEELNSKIDDNKRWKEFEAEVAAVQARYDEKSKDIDAVDYTKNQMIARFKFPIDGVSFSTDGGLLFKDLPLKQASQAQQIHVAIGLAMMQKPKLRVLWIRQGALLDLEYLKLIVKIAAEYDVQLLIERVGKGDECGVIIEDGAVAENRLEAQLQGSGQSA